MQLLPLNIQPAAPSQSPLFHQRGRIEYTEREREFKSCDLLQLKNGIALLGKGARQSLILSYRLFNESVAYPIRFHTERHFFGRPLPYLPPFNGESWRNSLDTVICDET